MRAFGYRNQLHAAYRTGSKLPMNPRAPTTLVMVAVFCLIAGTEAQAQGAPACSSSTTVLFNQYGTQPIATGSTIWFSGFLEGVESNANDLGTSPVHISVTNSKITFGNWPYVVPLPDSSITLDSSVRDEGPMPHWLGNSWELAYRPSDARDAYFQGTPYVAPEPFIVAHSGPVTWTATFTASRPGITVHWAWSAAAYSQFGVNGQIGIKILGTPTSSDPRFDNGDPAGTPELWKSYVIAGAMGSGAPQYTGARSETASVEACDGASAPGPVPASQPYFSPPRTFIAPPYYGAPPVAPATYSPSGGMSAADWVGLVGGIAGILGALISILTYRRDRVDVRVPLGGDYIVIRGKDAAERVREAHPEIPANDTGHDITHGR